MTIKRISGKYSPEIGYSSQILIYTGTKKISELLRLKIPEFIKKSDMEELTGRKVDSILNICDYLGADEYISGPAAKNYIDLKGVSKT